MAAPVKSNQPQKKAQKSRAKTKSASKTTTRKSKRPEPGENPVGRPVKEIDMKRLIAAVRIQCTAVECAALFDCSEDTLDRRLKDEGYANFAEFYKKHSHNGKASLRRMQWKSAQDGNVTMQIWLGKQVLDQRDKHDVEMNVSDDIAELLDARRKRAKASKSG